ncbi:bifunctional DedA family/phosphatase PAP2 family protein [Pseudomonas sp. PDM11]|uniref:bifunctional DedA family/phosphatase PAP2 family protein n=1 Tax=Pseudomonas sp. PDM11 TaxID=2769309 RepID=UPI0017853E14|nr:bifunctional DedA family/phosphatase PAP2 family protein [Pseudomonas sp. PDM11]MBD9396289.1 bifunctional DedA family/phosphatase PAP2 family protein [Pseudomonas sp. PDM11]
MGQWLDSLTTWLAANPQWLGLAIFVIACIECLAIAGIIVPGTVLLFAVGVMAGNGALSLWETLLLAYLGGLLGDAISYALGRYFHQDIRRLPGLRSHPQWLSGAETYFERYGVASLLLGRYIGPLRPMLPMVAGMLSMPLGRFIAVSMLAAAGWSVAYLMPGWAAGAALRLPLPDGFWPQAAVVAGGLTLLLVLTIQSSLREQRQASLIAAGLGSVLLIALFIGWPHLIALDQGLMKLIQEERNPRFDHIAVLITHFGDFGVQFAVAALLCILLLLNRQWQALLFAGGAMLSTALGNRLFKGLFERARPDVLLEPLHTYSFPSGHSSAAFAFFLSVAILAGRGQPARLRLTWILLACLPALFIALSRVYLGVHWPSDIIAGALLASSLCALSLALMQRYASLPPLPARAWWMIVPACALLLTSMALMRMSEGVEIYRY